jgi:hypothetical protein
MLNKIRNGLIFRRKIKMQLKTNRKSLKMPVENEK